MLCFVVCLFFLIVSNTTPSYTLYQICFFLSPATPVTKDKKTMQTIRKEFAEQIASWTSLRSANNDYRQSERFLVSLVQSNEDGASREHRAEFYSEQSAHRFWTFMREIESTWSGSSVDLLQKLIVTPGEVSETLGNTSILSTDCNLDVWFREYIKSIIENTVQVPPTVSHGRGDSDVWYKMYIALVRQDKLECPYWFSDSGDGNWTADNLSQEWFKTCSSQPIRAVFRMSMFY